VPEVVQREGWLSVKSGSKDEFYGNPKRKPRDGERTAEEKAQNRAISRTRIRIERTVGDTKGYQGYRIVRDIYRLLAISLQMGEERRESLLTHPFGGGK